MPEAVGDQKLKYSGSGLWINDLCTTGHGNTLHYKYYYTLLWWYTSALHGFPQKCTLSQIKLIKWGPVLLYNCGGGGGVCVCV